MSLRNPVARTRIFLAAAFCSFAALLSGCSQDKTWDLDNITGIVSPLAFSLTDDTGRHVTAETYRGKIVMLYFGYTHCPDVCPTTLATLSQALSKLGTAADKVRILFVTVDPQRDTPPLLKRYAEAFGPEFIGLRTDDPALRQLAKRYRVTYSLGKPDAHGNYEATHSSAVFIFDGKGKARLMAESSSSAVAIAHDVQQLIDGA
ncbi:MAG: SCO family protein [Betaproteobacteria bacterium]|nr:SCO family protein [Betaproteobacteria bacterium]